MFKQCFRLLEGFAARNADAFQVVGVGAQLAFQRRRIRFKPAGP